ncbi:hypothetical protein D3C80_1568630 [compost metagenome]
MRRHTVEQAERHVQRQQQANQRQRQHHAVDENQRTGLGQCQKTVAVERLGLDRQGMEAVDQQGNQPQMAVKTEEQQHCQQVEQPRQHRGVRPAAGVKEGGERQTHLHADHFAGQAYCREGELHGQPQRHADQDLLCGQP